MDMKVSIITTTYNSENTIRDTLESVLKQTHQDIEYILVDGLSKDETTEIIKAYEPKFNGKLRWISDEDNGIYDALNKGIRMAKGEVVGILNSDDFFTSNDVLERIVKTMQLNKCDAVYGDIHFVKDSDLTTCVRYYSSLPFRRWTMRMGFMPAHPSFYVYKNIYEKLGLFSLEYKIAADFELLLRFIFVNRIKTIYIPMDFVTMRQGGVSTSGLKSHITIFKEHLKALKANNVYSNTLFLGLRYLYKIVEIVYFRFLTKKQS